MVKKKFAVSNRGGRKLVVASATVAALAMPLAFATPSVAIARAESTVQAFQGAIKGATAPTLNDFNNAKEKTVTEYETALNNLKTLQNDPSLTTDAAYNELVAKQQAELTPLVQDVEALRNDLVAINETANKINTTNQDTLNAYVSDLNKLAATATDAEQNMKNAEQTITTKRVADQKKMTELNAKVADAKKAFEAKFSDFETFKKTYEQKAAEYSDLKSQYDAELAKINAQIEELKQQISALPKNSDEGYDAANEKAAQIQEQIDALKTQRDQVETQFNDTDASYKELQGKYETLQNEYKNAQAVVDSANDEIAAFNKQIETDNATLENSYNTAKAAYDEAMAERKNLENTIAQQKQVAQAENAKNQKVYEQAKAKLDTLSAKMTEFNQARKDTIGEIQTTKTKLDDAYTAVTAALTKLNDAMQTAKQALDTYNNSVDAYNADEQKAYDTAMAKYNADMQAYNTAKAEYEQKMQQMEQNKDKPGNLSIPQGQALSWGNPTNITAQQAYNNGDIKWQTGQGEVVHDPVNNKDGISVDLAPNASNTVIYKGSAISNMKIGNTDITSVRITYHNPNIYPISVMANQDLRQGFTQGWTRNGLVECKSGDSVQANIPKNDTFLVNTDVTMEFLHDGTPINFTNQAPVILFMSSLNYHSPDDIEGVLHWNFDKVIPITGSSIVEETSIPGAAEPIPTINAGNPILAGKEITDIAWDSPSNPDWYKLSIAGAKTSGSTIKFTATVAEPGGRAANDMNGIWFAFYSDSPIEHLPVIPALPEKPELKKMDREAYTFNTPEVAIEPKTVVPKLNELTPPVALPALIEVKEGVIQIPIAPSEPAKPIPAQTLNMIDSMPVVAGLDVVAPEAPQALPDVPNVPKKINKKKGNTPKTSDTSSFGLAGILALAGTLIASKKNRNEV